jgi:2,5-diketo-D-gluconate reductase B
LAVTNGIPPMGFGTFGRTGSAGIEALLFALETGYRHLDTAQSYGTERECGEALRRSGLKREDVFLTTKIDGQNCRRGRLIESLKRSNETIGVDAVDLTLIHWPVSPGGKLPMDEYLPELAEAQDLRLTRLIGVSNFTIEHLREAESMLGTDWLATNQFERHPLLRNQKLVDTCTAHAIAVTCYLPLARGRCAGIPAIEAVAATHNATPHQIALAMSLTEGHIVIPTSAHPQRIAENYAALAIQLSSTDLDALRSADRSERQINPSWSPAWD